SSATSTLNAMRAPTSVTGLARIIFIDRRTSIAGLGVPEGRPSRRRGALQRRSAGRPLGHASAAVAQPLTAAPGDSNIDPRPFPIGGHEAQRIWRVISWALAAVASLAELSDDLLGGRGHRGRWR